MKLFPTLPLFRLSADVSAHRKASAKRNAYAIRGRSVKAERLLGKTANRRGANRLVSDVWNVLLLTIIANMQSRLL